MSAMDYSGAERRRRTAVEIGEARDAEVLPRRHRRADASPDWLRQAGAAASAAEGASEQGNERT